MYIKWIVCTVKEDKRLEFSIAQEQWSETALAEGFIAQFGGWDNEHENEACIISFWESKRHLEDFMKSLHDTIFAGNNQAETYDSIMVRHFDSDFHMKVDIGNLIQKITGRQVLLVDSWKVEKPGQ